MGIIIIILVLLGSVDSKNELNRQASRSNASDLRSKSNPLGYDNAVRCRQDLESLGVYDNLKENWDETLLEIKEGKRYFTPRVSRVDKRTRERNNYYPRGYWFRCKAQD